MPASKGGGGSGGGGGGLGGSRSGNGATWKSDGERTPGSLVTPLLNSDLEGDTKKMPSVSQRVQYDDVAYAAWIVEDSLEGHLAESYPYGDKGIRLRQMTNDLHDHQTRLNVVVVVLVAMMLFEPPLWCQNSRDVVSFLSFAERCSLPDGSVPDSFNFFIIPPLFSLVLEVACMVIVTITLLHEKTLNQEAEALNFTGLRREGSRPEMFLYVTWAMWVDISIYGVIRQNSFRFAPFGRMVLLFYWPRVRGVFVCAANCIDEFANLMIFIFGTVMIFAWVFMMLLDDIVDRSGNGGNHTSLAILGGKHFMDISSALSTFFEIETGANFPDDIIPMVTKMRWTVGIFYPFMIITFFLFTQLMLAIIYNEYQRNLREGLKDFYVKRIQGVAKAFCILSTENHSGGERVIHMETFQDLCNALQMFPAFRKRIKQSSIEILFAALDDDGSRTLSLKEFFDACDYLQMQFWTVPQRSAMVRKGYVRLDGLHRFIAEGKLCICVNVILVVNFLAIINASWLDMQQKPAPWWTEPVSVILSLLYCVDIQLRLLDTSFANYWMSGMNRFDFLSTWLLFTVTIGTQVSYLREELLYILPYLNLLRVVRIFRLLMNSVQFNLMTTCIIKLVSISGDIAILLIVTMYSFAVIGIQAFGGTLYPSNPLLEGSVYEDEKYQIFNFNDMFGSILTLMNMMICSYMPEYADALGRVSPWYGCGMLYCMTFFFFGVNIAFNIFTAFTIDVFVTLQEQSQKNEQTEEDKNLEAMRTMLDKEGLILHIVIPSAVMQARVQMDLIENLDDIVEEAQQQALQEVQDRLAVQPRESFIGTS